jgi:hypothetical protein
MKVNKYKNEEKKISAYFQSIWYEFDTGRRREEIHIKNKQNEARASTLLLIFCFLDNIDN